MSKPNLIGKVLNYVHLERDILLPKLRTEIWERNNMREFDKRDDYRLEELTTVDKDGNILTTLRLWKKIDEIEMKINVDVSTDVSKMERKDIHPNVTDRKVEEHDTKSPL